MDLEHFASAVYMGALPFNLIIFFFKIFEMLTPYLVFTFQDYIGFPVITFPLDLIFVGPFWLFSEIHKQVIMMKMS